MKTHPSASPFRASLAVVAGAFFVLAFLPRADADPPAVTLTAPVDGQLFMAGDNVPVAATATNLDGTITNVDFYVDGVRRFRNPIMPYGFTLGDITLGPHALQAVATDIAGLAGTSAVVTVFANLPADEAVLVPNGSVWRYKDTGTDLGHEWRAPFYDDHFWPTGAGELGYGDAAPPDERPETTVVSYGPDPANKYITTYFRLTFAVPDPGVYTNLLLRLLRDDGAVVYLNGLEVFRSNMNPTNDILFGTLALGPAPDDGSVFVLTNVNPALLVAGPNVLAVEVHQDVPDSPDLSFDLLLTGQQGPRPVDCNGNGIDDATDIADGTSCDANHDGIPDECQSSITLKQLSFTEGPADFVQRFSRQGVVIVHAPQPGPGQLCWFNLIFNGRWVVQNLPLQAASAPGVFHDYSVGFSLDTPVGVPVTTGMAGWTLSPQPSAAPPAVPAVPQPVSEKPTQPSTTAGVPGEPPKPYSPEEPTDFTNAPPGEGQMIVSRTDIPQVDEETNHCGPGAGARCLGWMSKEYDLGLTNAQSIYNTLKDTNHMMTTDANGTDYGNISGAMPQYLSSNNVAGFTSQYNSSGSPADLIKELKTGQDVIMLMGFYGASYTTNGSTVVSNYGRLGGHIVVATSVTLSTNGDTNIGFHDDVFGETDNQGDGRADDGQTRVATVKTNATGGWLLTGFGAESHFEGFVQVCPPPEKIVSTALRWLAGSLSFNLEGLTPRLQRLSGGGSPTPEELNQLNAWSCLTRDDAGYLFNTLQASTAPPLSVLLADVSAAWSSLLQADVADFGRNPGIVPTEMLLLSLQSQSAITLIGNCLNDPSNCGGTSRPLIQMTPLGPHAAELSWTGSSTLQYAPSVLGPWSDQTNVTSPAFITTGQPAGFYRLVAQPTDQGCLYGIKGVISGGCPVGSFLCVSPCPGIGACPTPPQDASGRYYVTITDNTGTNEMCRLEVSPTVPCNDCAVSGFVVTHAVWIDPVAGKIMLQ